MYRAEELAEIKCHGSTMAFISNKINLTNPIPLTLLKKKVFNYYQYYYYG